MNKQELIKKIEELKEQRKSEEVKNNWELEDLLYDEFLKNMDYLRILEKLNEESEADFFNFVEFNNKIEDLKKQIKEIEKQKKELEIKILNDNGYKVGSTFEDYGTKYIITNDFLYFRPMRKDGQPSNSKESTKQLNLYWLKSIKKI